MPIREVRRDTMWLLPPSLDEFVGPTHMARFVAAYVEDHLDDADWDDMGIKRRGARLGSPAYAPRSMVAVWLYGFMTGVRSTRELERACRENVAYMWLTGCQYPDHSTLWHFYQAHRQGMRRLFKHTIKTAVAAGLVDLAVQAVDGTKVGGNAARKHTLDAAGVQDLLTRVEKRVADLEANDSGGAEPTPPELPAALASRQALRTKLQEAKAKLEQPDGPERLNLTDEDATIMKTSQGFIAGYNAQAVVAPLNPTVAKRSGLFITGAEVGTNASDSPQLEPMVQQAHDNVGQPADLTLADGGYHSGPNLVAMEQRGQKVAMPEAHHGKRRPGYEKDDFSYDAERNVYVCPQGSELAAAGTTTRTNGLQVLRYRANPERCSVCPVSQQCTADKRGRSLEVTVHREQYFKRHRDWMATPEAHTAYRQRQQLVEPAFGILKDCQGARRFLLRGIQNVQAEWSLLVTTFNLRTLWRVWQQQGPAMGVATAGC